MTPEHQRIAIAQACGYVLTPLPQNPNQKTWQRYGYTEELADYLNDLPAMRSAALQYLNGASATENWTYAEHLGRITGSGSHITTALIFATSAQHAEAFLRTIGKWEDSFPTSEEAKVILEEEGIDTTELKSWASGKLSEIKSRLPGISQEVAG